MITLSANIASIAPEALRHAVAAGIVHRDIRRGLDVLVQGAKACGMWNKLAALYPMMGGSAWSCKFNIKNPVDSDLAFRLTYVAAPPISHKGIAFNGTTQYADTKCNPSTNGVTLLDSAHLSYYSTAHVTGTAIDMGYNTAATITYYVMCWANTYQLNSSNTEAFTNTDTRGFLIATRTTSTLTTMYKYGLFVDDNVDASTSVPSGNIYIGCRNNNGTAANFTSRSCAGASIGSGLTASQAFWFSNIFEQAQIIVFHRSVKNVA